MSDVPRSKLFDDIYFSPEDGQAETTHVFIHGNKLPERFIEKETFTICETGFGTGLNFLVAWDVFSGGHLHFISFEKYPLSKEEIEHYMRPLFEQNRRIDFDAFLEAYPTQCRGRHDLSICENVILTLIFEDVNAAIPRLEESVDAWFLDGFAPAKNPDMWTETLFQNMARLSQDGTTFATFTAAGFVKRGLQSAGFAVEKVRGFGRKREMLRGGIVR